MILIISNWFINFVLILIGIGVAVSLLFALLGTVIELTGWIFETKTFYVLCGLTVLASLYFYIVSPKSETERRLDQLKADRVNYHAHK